MMQESGRKNLLTALGISAGVATGVAAGFWLWRRRSPALEDELDRWAEPRGSAQDVADAFRDDPKLSRRRVEVDAIAEGVVELSGSVRDRGEADRAVGIAHRTTGVYTVVNRLRIEEEEAHRQVTRQRRDDGDPALRERKHYGMGVGMGSPRHSPATDPARPSDKQQILERELDVGRVDDPPDSPPHPVSGAAAVDDPLVKPGDEDAIREAGLDPSPRPISTPKESRPESGPDGETGEEAEEQG